MAVDQDVCTGGDTIGQGAECDGVVGRILSMVLGHTGGDDPDPVVECHTGGFKDVTVSKDPNGNITYTFTFAPAFALAPAVVVTLEVSESYDGDCPCVLVLNRSTTGADVLVKDPDSGIKANVIVYGKR